jgi:hypothetical protein
LKNTIMCVFILIMRMEGNGRQHCVHFGRTFHFASH